MTGCFQHPDRDPEVTFSLYDRGQLVTLAMCPNCRHAAALAALVYENMVGINYEIVGIEE